MTFINPEIGSSSDELYTHSSSLIMSMTDVEPSLKKTSTILSAMSSNYEENSIEKLASEIALSTISLASDIPLLTLGLVNAVTDEIVVGYEDLASNGTINLDDLNLTDYSIVALVNPDHPNSSEVESIRFESTVGNRTENITPYALFGDKKKGNDYLGQPISEGDYSLTATAYSENRARGDVLGEVTINYTFISATTNPTPAISISDASADENSDVATFTVTLSESSHIPISVDYVTADGTAIAGNDYTATSGTLTFAAGETSKTVSVPLTDDSQFEGDETFTVNLSNPTEGATLANNNIGIGTIIDNELPPTISISNASADENADLLTFTISLSESSNIPISVDYTTADGTAIAGNDYTATSGTLTFAAGETSKTVFVPLTDDSQFEEDETFIINLSNPSGEATLANNSATGIIIDNELPPAISISNANADENADLVTFTVSLSESSNITISVDYTTADETAIAGNDYTATSGTLTFAAGETSTTFSVTIADDTQFEEDETFIINLSNPSGEATLANNVAIGTIFDNDSTTSEPPPESVLDFSLPPDKLMEQQMLLDIVPDGSETHRAINNGSWFDPNTWANGIIPTEGARVYIPANIKVEYDGQSDIHLWTVRVDGNLSFSQTKDSKMVIDTLAVMYSGQLNIGTKEQPIGDNVTAEIVFADDQRSLDDPMAMGLGLVSIGEVNIYGQEKQSHLKVANDPLQGDTSITLAEVLVGWEVGDRVVLTGTKYIWSSGNNRDQSEDEVLTITSINGQTITFDTPLQFNHDTPRDDLKAYVANLSRNVVLRSEITENIARRGHVMLMHNDNVDIRFAHFQELGRTDKSRVIDNNTDNINGRYALHLHRQGVALDNNPAIIVGNSVEGSPGWGYVHHSSYAVMDYNVAYDVFGGAFIAESGDETGRWENNIAIKGTGVGGKEGNPKNTSSDFNEANNGTGFYFQGRLVHNQNNIAASMPGWGFLYFHRGTATSVGRVDSSTIEEPLTTRYKTDETQKGVSIDHPSIQGFANNETFAAGKGLEVIKNTANQHHDGRTILDGFLAWEVQNGAAIQYTGHYTLEDFELIAHDNSSAKYWSSTGLSLGQKMVDIVVNNLYVENFYDGVGISTSAQEQFNDLPGNTLFIDYEAVNVDVRIDNSHINGHVTEVNSSEIQSGMVSLNLDPSTDLHIESLSGQERITLQGTKTDSTGTFTYGILGSHADLQNIYNIELRSLLAEGYYTLPNNEKAIILPELISERIFGNTFVQDLVVTVSDSLIKDELPYLGELNATDDNKDGIWEINSAPQAAFDAVKIDKNGSVIFSVLENDSDIDGDDIALQNFTNVANGTLELIDELTGTFRYTANFNHDGYDYFNYSIADPNGSGRSRTGQVQLKIETVDW